MLAQMPLDVKRFSALRPYLFHLTARSNWASIEREGRIESAMKLLGRAGRLDSGGERRRDHLIVEVEGRSVILRDQGPLHAGHVALGGGWEFAELVKCLNEQVFFWPGEEIGPIPHGRRHFERYRDEDVVVLVVKTDAAFEGHSGDARFCRYNSGSPRCSGGRKSPRGPGTFVRADEFEGTAGEVVEVTFEGQFLLPRDVRATEVWEWVGR